MTFGEKIRILRKEKGLSQTELGKSVGASLRTVRNWELEGRYPKKREIYSKLAEILDCDVAFLLTDSASFVTDAEERYGYRGRKDAEQLVSEVTGLFAGGEMDEEDMDAMMFAIQQAYVDAKRNNQKYTPKKYLKAAGQAVSGKSTENQGENSAE